MNKGDALVERGAQGLQGLAEKAAARGGVGERLGQQLAEDAAFLRKLKPSLMVARARGELPTDQEPGSDVVAPSGPRLGARPGPPREGGPNPFLVVAAALGIGIALAKIIDWRSHAHPRE